MDFKNEVLSTLDIYDALDRCNTQRFCRFKVLSWNCVPRSPKSYPTLYVINEDDSFSPGSHWTALFHPSENSFIEYFDSFGKTPREELVGNKPYLFNTEPLQNLFTSVCGHYCLLFVWYRIHLGKSMDIFIDEMKKKSDEQVLSESEKIFFI